jgi:hypothetical protein
MSRSCFCSCPESLSLCGVSETTALPAQLLVSWSSSQEHGMKETLGSAGTCWGWGKNSHPKSRKSLLTGTLILVTNPSACSAEDPASQALSPAWCDPEGLRSLPCPAELGLCCCPMPSPLLT